MYKGILSITAILLAVTAVFAAVPSTINYPGLPEKTGGTPVNTQVSVVFELYAIDPVIREG